MRNRAWRCGLLLMAVCVLAGSGSCRTARQDERPPGSAGNRTSSVAETPGDRRASADWPGPFHFWHRPPITGKAS